MPWLRALGPRALAALLAAAITGGPAAGAAAAPASEPSAGSETAPQQDAQRLYDRGRAKFETADYAAAIELWTEAYASVPETAQGTQIKVLLIYNLATARSKQFEVSRDPAELRQASILLRNYEQQIPNLYGDGEEADVERTKVEEKLAALDRQLAEHEAAKAKGDDEGEGEPEGVPDASPPAETNPADRGDEPATGARGLVIGGAVAAGLGAGGLGLMAGGLAIGARANDISGIDPADVESRRAQFDRGRVGNTLAIVGVAVGAPLLVAGAVMLALGLRRGRSGNTALVPALAPTRGGAGLVLQGRF